mgnify:CR=1 FL=1
MTAPTDSLGTSTTSRSMGSHFLPSMVWYSTRGGRDLELIALPAHGLNEDGQTHFATARHVEGVGGAIQLRDPQGDILQGLTEQPLPQLAGGDELALTPGIGGSR